jgi:hypothetical protein
MKVAIMQPYFLPYIGYFQLMNAVDEFIVYDNIKFTKKGWINRNRILVNGKDSFITLPLKRDSDFLDVKDRRLADSWEEDRKKLINRITGSYGKAPGFNEVFEMLEQCILFNSNNLFEFILNSLESVKFYLDIKTPLIPSSAIAIDHDLKAQDKVIEICKTRKATGYLNPIGGLELYSREEFKKEGIDLGFVKSRDIIYNQFGNKFIPWLSIVDVMMFNPTEKIKEYLASLYMII